MGSTLSHLSWEEYPVSRRTLLTTYLPIVGCSYIVYSFGIKPFLSPLRKLPGLPYHPIFGNIREAIKGEAMETSIKWVAKYGGIVRYYTVLGRESVLVADPAALKEIFVTEQQNYGRPKPTAVPFGRSVITLTGEEHKAHRLLLNPVFSPEMIKGHVSLFDEYGRRLVDRWCHLASNGATRVAVQEDLYKMTFDIFGMAVFGQDFKSLENHDSAAVAAFLGMLSMDTVSFMSYIPFSEYLPTKKSRERSRCRRIVEDFINNLLEEKRKQLDGKEVSMDEIRRDLLGCLLLAHDDSGLGLSSQAIFNELLTLIFAGYETTAMTMSWILLTLAQHPKVQHNVRSEVTALLPPGGEPVNWKTLESMKYLECVVKECQRLYPAAATIPRYAAVDVHLGGYSIPRGTRLVCHIGTMMRSASVWKNPNDFCPERFLDSSPPMYSFLPFGTGPTKCLGHLFARAQMKMVIAQILRHFHLETIPGFEVRRKHRIILKAVPSIELSLKLIE